MGASGIKLASVTLGGMTGEGAAAPTGTVLNRKQGSDKRHDKHFIIEEKYRHSKLLAHIQGDSH